jgi:hypothetical protein
MIRYVDLSQYSEKLDIISQCTLGWVPIWHNALRDFMTRPPEEDEILSAGVRESNCCFPFVHVYFYVAKMDYAKLAL